MTNAIDSSFLSKWFTGKALTNAADAIALLNESIALGYWAPKASVKVPSALAKANKAIKIGKQVEAITKSEQTEEVRYYNHPLYGVANLFGYNDIMMVRLTEFDFTAVRGLTHLIADIEDMAADFRPVVAAIAKLNKESDANKKVAKQGDSKNPMGICACCFNAQKVQPNGKMFKHGYERPGYGYIIGGCPGSEFLPYSM
jgi:hypothetical protein